MQALNLPKCVSYLCHSHIINHSFLYWYHLGNNAGMPQTNTMAWVAAAENSFYTEVILLQQNQDTWSWSWNLVGQPLQTEKKRERDRQRRGINKWPCRGQAVMGWYKRGCGFPEGVCSGPALVCLGAYHRLLCPFSIPQHTSSDIHTPKHTHKHTHTWHVTSVWVKGVERLPTLSVWTEIKVLQVFPLTSNNMDKNKFSSFH